MQEAFLHYVWQYRLFNTTNLKTVNGNTLSIKTLGQYNLNTGPDFFNAQLQIGHQLWAGNVEIHIKSSDWYVHHHETDKNYDNVILHVVWEHDTEIFRNDNTAIPTLELKQYIQKNSYKTYTSLMQSKQWINCEGHFADVEDFVIQNWLERLYIERLNRKWLDIETLLKKVNNDWEAVLFFMMTKTFGLKVNADAFFSLAKSFSFSILRKLQHNLADLEALLFGQAHLLNDDIQDAHYTDLQQRYQFLQQKFKLDNFAVLPFQFFRLRPPNFPTIRLAQLAALYHTHVSLFSKLIQNNSKTELYKLFQIKTSTFWDTHYTFSKASKTSKKTLTPAFIDLVLINTILPVKFGYAKYSGKPMDAMLLEMISDIKPETNSITKAFFKLKPMPKNALTTQGLIQLKTEYCEKNNCLQCAIGNTLIRKNS